MKTRTACLLSWASLVSHTASGFSYNTQDPQPMVETACGPADWTTAFGREAARPFCDQIQCLAALRIAASSLPSGRDDQRPVYATAYKSIVHVCANSTHLHRTLASSQAGNAGGGEVPQTPIPAPSSPPATAPSPTSAPSVTTAPTMQPPRTQLPPSGTAPSPPPTTIARPPTTAPTTQPPRTQLPQQTAPVTRSPLPSSGSCTKEVTSKIPSYPEYKRAVGACGPRDGTPGSIGISGAAYCSNSECVLAFKAYVAVLPTCTIDGRSVQAAYQEVVDLCRGVVPVITQPRPTTAPVTTLPLPGGPPRTGSCSSEEILRMSSLPLLQGVVNACGPGNWGSGIISGTAFCIKSECVRALEAYAAELPTCILDTATGLSVRAAFLAAIDVCRGVTNVPTATTLKPVDTTPPSAPSPTTTAVVPPDSPISPSTTAVPPPVLGAPVPATTSPAASSTTSGSVAGANSAVTVDNTTKTTAIERNPDKVGVFPTPVPSTANVAPTPV
jgi:hypothetical protein